MANSSMSGYLGLEERRPKFERPRIDHGGGPGGPISQGYEDYVRGIFRPNEAQNSAEESEPSSNYGVSDAANIPPIKTGIDFDRLTTRNNSSIANSKYGGASSTPVADALSFDGYGTVGEGQPRQLSALTMLRMENQFGKEALDESFDNTVLKTPMESIYEELGIDRSGYGYGGGGARKGFTEFPVYTPKSSSEYFTQRQNVSNSYDVSGSNRGSFRTYREQSDDDWKRSNRQMLIDYKDFDSSPLSPYMYQAHPYVQRQDSRIIGSNFVQLTTRPRDRFLDKIDQTLAEVRAMPRY